MVLSRGDRDIVSAVAEHGDAAPFDPGFGHVAYAFREVFETGGFDLSAEVGGRPESVGTADLSGEAQAGRGVGVQYVVNLPVRGGDHYLYVTYVVFVPGE